jgi:hypothetical protein
MQGGAGICKIYLYQRLKRQGQEMPRTQLDLFADQQTAREDRAPVALEQPPA